MKKKTDDWFLFAYINNKLDDMLDILEKKAEVEMESNS